MHNFQVSLQGGLEGLLYDFAQQLFIIVHFRKPFVHEAL
jgi:hypothetical protein